MAEHHPANERVKREYLGYLKEAKRHSEETVDAVAKSLARFEAHTGFRDFKKFHSEQAVAFKRHLAEQNSETTGEKLSKATLYSTSAHLKAFFQWLAWRPGYKSGFKYADAEYFNLSDNDTRIATARREKRFPTIEQVKHVIAMMPAGSDIQLRNRALVAFTLLTAARDSAIASMSLKHVDVVAGSAYQDAREVRTKRRKTFTTFFFPIGDEIRQIVVDWVTYLREVKLWGNDDPVFPATNIGVGAGGGFEAVGLKREHWRSAAPIRTIFRDAFVAAGLSYFNPHSLRNTLVQFGETVCQTPEQFKSWSQNLGHEGVLTTFCSYGEVSTRRQGEIIKNLTTSRSAPTEGVAELARAFLRELGNK